MTSTTHRRIDVPRACMHEWSPQYQFAAGGCWCRWSTQLYTQQSSASLFELLRKSSSSSVFGSQSATRWPSFTRIQTAQIPVRREGGRADGGMFLSTSRFPLFLPLKQILAFSMGGGRGGGGRDPPQGEQGEEEKQSRMGKKKRCID